MNEMTPETPREQAQPGTMRPEQIEGLRPENPYASFADYNRACLIATIFALAEALRYAVYPGSDIAKAPAIVRVAAWLEEARHDGPR